MKAEIIRAAQVIRESHPWIPLCDALTYADPATVQYRSFRGDFRGGFFGTGVSRESIAFAWEYYAVNWGPIDRSTHVNLGPCATLETEDDEEIKQVYGAIVKREQRLYVGFERLSRKAGRRMRLSWPGTSHMKRGAWSYLESERLLNAVLACVGDN